MPPDNEIAKVPPGFENVFTTPAIDKLHHAAIWNTEPPVHLSPSQFVRGKILVTARAGINWFIISGMRPVQSLHHIAPRTDARIDHPRLTKSFECALIQR